MFRFAKPSGEGFNLDYQGPICAFDSGNDLVAVCLGASNILSEFLSKIADRQNVEIDNPEAEGYGDPSLWDDWKIVISASEKKARILQGALATAWSAVALCERIIV